jgi:adenylylsulfate kinase-like enzyme
MDEVSSVPGFTAPYEAPEKPDVVVHGDSESPDSAARRVVAEFIRKGYIQRTGLC